MFNKIVRGICLFFTNPLLFFKYLRKFWIETILIKLPGVDVVPQNFQKNINGVLFGIDFAFFPKNEHWLRQMRFGLYEIATVECIKKILKKGDVFIDVGAHIGYLTAVGASLVGKEGQVYSFEPVPLYFEYVRKLALQNPGYKIVPQNCALGDKTGTAVMCYGGPFNSGGSSLVAGELNPATIEGSINVSVRRIDDYLRQNKLEVVDLIKIDVEGFEFPVLKGLKSYFENTNYRPSIICEITPSAYPLLNYKREQFIAYMKRYGYDAYNIMAPWRKVDITKFKEGTNVVFKTSKQ